MMKSSSLFQLSHVWRESINASLNLITGVVACSCPGGATQEAVPAPPLPSLPPLPTFEDDAFDFIIPVHMCQPCQLSHV